MKMMYPIIRTPMKPSKIVNGLLHNPDRHYKHEYCRLFKITGSRYRKIQKLQRRILNNANIKL